MKNIKQSSMSVEKRKEIIARLKKEGRMPTLMQVLESLTVAPPLPKKPKPPQP